MSTPNETITLRTCFSNGTGGEAELFHMAEFDVEHQPLGTPRPLTADSNQPLYVKAFTQATDSTLGPLDVDIRSIGKAPLNIASAVITIKDGRVKADGSDVTYTIQVNITQNPDLQSIEVVSRDAVRQL